MNAQPSKADAKLELNIAIFAVLIAARLPESAISIKNSDIVKPIPPKSPTIPKCFRLIPSGNLAILSAEIKMSEILKFPETSQRILLNFQKTVILRKVRNKIRNKNY